MTQDSISRRRMRLRSVQLSALAVSLFTLAARPLFAAEPVEPPTGATAAPSAQAVAEAAQRYDRGLRLYSEGEYRLAVIEFERTYELVPDYRVLYNIGQVRIQLGDYARARTALEQYLQEGAAQIPAARGEAVKNDLEMLEGRTATLMIQTNPPGAEVLLDGEVLGVTPLDKPTLMNAGDHSVEVRKAGYRTRLVRRTLAGKDAGELMVELDEIPATVASPEASPKQAPPAPPRSTTPIWIGWSTTAVLAAGAAVTGIWGMKAADDLDDMKERLVEPSELDSQARKAKTLTITGDALTAAAVIAGGVSLYLTLRSPSKADPQGDSASLGLNISPSRLTLIGRY